MEYDNVENLNEEQILELYNSVLERGDYISTWMCPVGLGTGKFTYRGCKNGREDGNCRYEICK